ncbi:MAG TPA: DUF3570 domain-containing protein [Polyangiales bacterium]|nr:DUF3570 domain-containing protein [Polyangiales bacterium]
MARRPSAALLFLVYALTASLAGADAASGTYTGQINARGNYYWEYSTRVVAPSINASLATPSGVRVDGTYLIDAISSASVATGTIDDRVFTEKRHDVTVGLGYEIELGKAQLDLYGSGRISREPDYKSNRGGFAAALSLNQRNTVLHFNGYFSHDDVYRVLRMVPADDPTKLLASRADFVGNLDVVSLGFAVDQVLNRSTSITLGYDLSLLSGFQANPYRMARFAAMGAGAEHHPDQRTRSAPYVWFSHFFERTRDAIRINYRFYRDDWDITAHAIDTRFHQEIGDDLELRLRYRYYNQSDSFFNKTGGYTAPDTVAGTPGDRYITADPKMTAFHDHTFGVKVRLALDFLSFTKLDFLHTAVVDWTIEYMRITNRYGPIAVVAQGGIGWSF